MNGLDTSILNPLPSSSIVGLSTTANSTPAYIIPNSAVGGSAATATAAPVSTPKPASVYSAAPSTVLKPAPQASGVNGNVSYTIKSGDTLSKIAAQYGTTVSALAEANGIANPNLIVAGKSLVIPSAAPVQTPTPATGGGANPADGGNKGSTSQPSTPNASAIAKAAGEAGLSVSDYITLLGGNTAVSSAEHQAIAKELGIPDAEAAAFAKPSKSTQQIYSDAYANAGLDALHAKILTLIDTINAEKQQGTDAIGTVNENPFLDEKSRVGRGQRILNQVNAKIANDSDMLKQLQDLYTQGVTEVNNLVTRTSQDFKDNQTNAQAYLNYLQTKAQQQAEGLKSDKSITASNTVTDYLKGRATATAAANAAKAPTVIGSAASGYYRWDAGTRSFVQVTKPTGGTTFNPTQAQKASVAQFLNSDAGKELTGGVAVTDADLNSVFGDQTTFYALLQQASDAGY